MAAAAVLDVPPRPDRLKWPIAAAFSGDETAKAGSDGLLSFE